MSDLETKALEAKQALQEWADKQGHDRCCYYPEIFERLAKILNVKPKKAPCLPSVEEFRKGCERSTLEQYNLDTKRV